MTDGYKLMKRMGKRIAVLPADEKKYIAERILEEVRGRMLEDIILLETTITKMGA